MKKINVLSLFNKLFFSLFLIFLIGCSATKKNLPNIDLPSNFKFRQLETYQGYDALGLAMYCNGYLTAPKLPAVSTLLRTFGNPLPCLEERIKQGGLKLVQIDLIDATCVRNKNCPKGSAKPDDLIEIEKRAKEIQTFIDSVKKYDANIIWQGSPALEHDIKDVNKVRQMLQAVKKGCPSCEPINSPFTGAKPEGYKLELHGTTVKATMVSGDGKSMFDADCLDSDGNNFNHCKSGSYATFGWIPAFNCRCTGEEGFITPLKRTYRPSPSNWIQVARLFKPEPPKPNKPRVCRTLRELNISKDEINKPNAENYCNGQSNFNDPRGDKPLLIITKKGSKKGEKALIYNSDSKEVGYFSFYGFYKDYPASDKRPDLFRWYVGSGSKETPTQLMNELGNEWGFVRFPDGECILFNAIRRINGR